MSTLGSNPHPAGCMTCANGLPPMVRFCPQCGRVMPHQIDPTATTDPTANLPYPGVSRVNDVQPYDPYQILGVSRGATVEQIRAAHRLRARLAHPDFGGSAGKLLEVNVAFEVLSDGARRAAYDRFYQNPGDPQVAESWREARIAAERAASGASGESFGVELDQMTARMQSSPGVRFAGGAIMGALVGGGIGALGGWYTDLPLWVCAAIGGGIGLLGGGWAGITNKAP